MNYYEHHLGDFARDAGHLSMLEEGAYRRLIDAYYGRQSPLPLDISQCKKLARVTRAPAEHRAVEFVLSQFFIKGEDGYHQKRCDEEIQRFKSKSSAGRANANARWGNADASNSHMRNRSVRIDAKNAAASSSHRVGNALQSPVSNHQSPKEKRGRGRGRGSAAAPPPARLPLDFELTEEREEIAEAQGVDPELTFEKFVDHFTAAPGPKGVKADWDAAWRIWCRDEGAGNFGSSARGKPNGANGHTDAAEGIWAQLLASDGARPARDSRIQAALDAVGGWSAVRHRTEFEAPKLKNAFCQAYRNGKERKGISHADG